MENITLSGIGRYEDTTISFYHGKELLEDYDKYVKFIKGCENCVRNDDRYTEYVGKVRMAGYNQCAILGTLTKKDKEIKLEMHHGPIFNLFDICDIVTHYHLRKGDQVTTFFIANEVLKAHEKDWIQVIMLSKTAHKSAHAKGRNIFIDTKATVGRIDKFIEHYMEGMEDDHIEMIEHYLEESKKVPISEDNGLFDTADRLKKFK